MPTCAGALWCAILVVLLVILIGLLVRAVRVNRMLRRLERGFDALLRPPGSGGRGAPRRRREGWSGPRQVAEEARMQWYAPAFDSVHG